MMGASQPQLPGNHRCSRRVVEPRKYHSGILMQALSLATLRCRCPISSLDWLIGEMLDLRTQNVGCVERMRRRTIRANAPSLTSTRLPLAEPESARFATTRRPVLRPVTRFAHDTEAWHDRATIGLIELQFDGSRVTMTRSVVPASCPAHQVKLDPNSLKKRRPSILSRLNKDGAVRL